MNDIIRIINKHKPKSRQPIVDNQITYIPTVEDDQIECMVPRYLVDGRRVVVFQAKQACFKLRYIKFLPVPPRVANEYKNGEWALWHLVDIKFMYPIMLFINGCFIPWYYINVVMCQDKYYLSVYIYDDNQFYLDLVRDVKWAKIITLPAHVFYEPGYLMSDESVLFAFDQYGQFVRDAHDHVFRTGTNHHIIYNFWNTTEPVNAQRIMDATSVKLTEKNVILFENRLLATGTKTNIIKAQECVERKDEETGHVRYCFDMEQSEEDLGVNPEVRFDSSLLSINNGTIPEGYMYDFGVFVNTKYTPTVDNINFTDLDGLTPYVEAENAGNPHEMMDNLQEPFKMKMDIQKHYDENVADAIKAMLSYNASLFNEAILAKSNLIIEEYTGAEFLSLLHDDGTVVLSREHNIVSDELILIMVNGLIYQYTHMIRYRVDECVIPVQGIKETDIVEVFRFKNIRNSNNMYITINEDDGFMNYDPDIINNEMNLFSRETNSTYFSYPSGGLQHFPVEYSLETDEEGKIKIILSNSLYYGKRLRLTYKYQYKHYAYTLTNPGNPEKFKFDLGDKFMYCENYHQYLIFLNGKRLSTEQYRMTLPVRDTTPFSRFEIYFTMPINDGDKLDVIYVPSMIKDCIYIPEIPTTGDIVVDKSLLGFDLSRDIYMVWVNGRKVPRSKLVDIDSTHMRIIADVGSTKSVSVTKFIPDIDAITPVFKENQALWDAVTSKLTLDEVYELLGITGETLTNTEAALWDDSINVRTIMFELIRDQYLNNPAVDPTDAFIYDYVDVDTSAIDGYDSAGNAILPVADANRTDNLDEVERYYP